ncbi:hypothetical protein JHK85_004827 [Glycine max]|nr:hypothetical protein JHK85_004827 [Glycine max]
MATTLVSSVGGMLAMLNEPHLSVKLHALSNLNNLVETFWPPLVDSLNYAVSAGFSSFNLSPNVRCMWFLRFKVIDLIASTAKLGSLLLMDFDFDLGFGLCVAHHTELTFYLQLGIPSMLKTLTNWQIFLLYAYSKGIQKLKDSKLATSANINNDQFGHKFEISCKAPMKKGLRLENNLRGASDIHRRLIWMQHRASERLQESVQHSLINSKGLPSYHKSHA